jgi:hypothetical protein
MARLQDADGGDGLQIWRVAENIVDQGKQAKLPWLQDPRKIKGDNMNNIRYAVYTTLFCI